MKSEGIARLKRPLGERHAGYGGAAENCRAIGDPPIWPLEQDLGDGCSPRLRMVWHRSNEALSETLKRGLRGAPIGGVQ